MGRDGPEERWLPRRASPYALLAVVTLIVLVPLVGKAFHVDEPLFVWTAQRIEIAPLDFYGFDVNWYGVEEPDRKSVV